MFAVGIVGLPNAGKSTLFKALTRQSVAIANFPFTTIEPNHGMVAVSDARLQAIADIVKPEIAATPALLEFIDIAGLVRGAHTGEGLGNQFLAKILEVDMIAHVVRVFEAQDVPHTEQRIHPADDIAIVNTELALKDLEISLAQKERWQKHARAGDKDAEEKLAFWQSMVAWLGQGKRISENHALMDDPRRDIPLLTAKPVMYIFNCNTGHLDDTRSRDAFANLCAGKPWIALDIKLEDELGELSPDEVKAMGLVSRIDEVLRACYNALGLITFYTITGGRESKAWAARSPLDAKAAAGKVHTDFADKFIRAQVVGFQDFIRAGSWARAKEQGLVRTEGKEYLVRDGDIIEFKI